MSATAPAPPASGLPPRRRFWAVAALMAGVAMSVLDASLVNLALPSIATAFGVGAGRAVWVTTAYLLAAAAAIALFAALGDRHGYRRVWLAGLTGFTLASAGCAVAPTLPVLLALRAAQGLAAAAVMSVGPALYRVIFPPQQLGRALGLSAMTVAASAAAGPSVAGAILGLADWRWLFIINLPVGLIALAAAAAAMPASARRTTLPDYPAVLLAGLSLVSLVLALGSVDHFVPATLLFTASLVCALTFARRQRDEHAWLPPVLWRNTRFSLAAATSAAAFAVQGLAYVSLSFRLQHDWELSAPMAGAVFTAWPLALALLAPLAGRAADRTAAAKLCTAGLLLLAGGLAALAAATRPSPAMMLASTALCGFGFALFQSPNNRELLGAAPRALSGTASGVLAIARTFGQSLGAAAAALLLSAAGSQLALALAALFALLAAGLSLSRRRTGHGESAA
ncbi:MAG: MFS transporter [Gammaproteobacteria bacterium]|nr:MFS transporter [Gammaproteobacteria bacterium]